MQYFLKRAADGVWEEVDDYVFTNRNYAVVGDKPRYTSDTVMVYGNEISINLTGPQNDLAIFTRALSVAPAKEVPGGFIKEANEVFFKRGKKHTLYRDGKEWQQVQEPQPKKPKAKAEEVKVAA
jgi:hypothetical protein